MLRLARLVSGTWVRRGHLLITGICLTAASGLIISPLQLAARAETTTLSEGHIQIEAPPGINVFLDDAKVGITDSKYGGLIIQSIASGTHRLRFVAEGYAPVDTTITVDEGEVLLFKLPALKSMLRITEWGREGSATLRAVEAVFVIQSLPIQCFIDAPQLQIAHREKTMDEWHCGPVQIGTYDLRFSALGTVLSHSLSLAGGDSVRLMVNFLDHTVTEISRVARLSPKQKAMGAKGSGAIDQYLLKRLPVIVVDPSEFGSDDADANYRAAALYLERGVFDRAAQHLRAVFDDRELTPIECQAWFRSLELLERVNPDLAAHGCGFGNQEHEELLTTGEMLGAIVVLVVEIRPTKRNWLMERLGQRVQGDERAWIAFEPVAREIEDQPFGNLIIAAQRVEALGDDLLTPSAREECANIAEKLRELQIVVGERR